MKVLRAAGSTSSSLCSLYGYQSADFFAVGHREPRVWPAGPLSPRQELSSPSRALPPRPFPGEVKILYHWAMSHLLLVVLGAVLVALLTAVSYTIALRKFKSATYKRIPRRPDFRTSGIFLIHIFSIDIIF